MTGKVINRPTYGVENLEMRPGNAAEPLPTVSQDERKYLLRLYVDDFETWPNEE